MFKIFGNKSVSVINGKRYVGNNITMHNGIVTVDGVVQNDNNNLNNKTILIEINCNVDKIECDESIVINGDVAGNINAGKNVSCDNVVGNVSAGTNVSCDDVRGNVSAGFNINCDRIIK